MSGTEYLLLLFSHSVVSDSGLPHGLQHTGFPVLQCVLEFAHSCWLSWWCHPTVLSSCPLLLLPSIFPNIRGFSNELALHIKWPKYCSFSFSNGPSSEHSGLISFVTESSSSLQSLSHVWLFVCDPMDCSTPGLPVHHQLPEFNQTYVHWVGDAIQPSHPLLSPPPAFNLSQHQGLFQWVSSSNQLAYRSRSFSFSINPSNEYSGLIVFRMNWMNLLAVQGTLKSHLQRHSSKASILQHSAFFMIQLSCPCMTTGKTIALIRWNFVGKETSLLFNMLIRLVITFLPERKRLLHSRLKSASAVIVEPHLPNKVCHCFHCFPFNFPWSAGTWCHDLSFLNVEF